MLKGVISLMDDFQPMSNEENTTENTVLEPKEKPYQKRLLYCLDFPFSVWFILISEFGERFCFYGFKTILSLYFLKFLNFSEDLSTTIYHLFIFVAYTTPVIGGYISGNSTFFTLDVFLGKYWTIFSLSLIYLVGQSLIAITAIPGVTGNPPHWWGCILGLFLVAIGTGGIKPCVSSFGGEQFDNKNESLVSSYFAIFYLCINIGSTISSFVTPILAQYYGYAIALYEISFNI